MIRSMTAFGSARRILPDMALALEIRSVNSRFLDLHLRLPDELRAAETQLRELLTRTLARGKVELRVTCERASHRDAQRLAPEQLQRIAEQWQAVRAVLPETPSPALLEILNWPDREASGDATAQQARIDACLAAASEVLAQLQDARLREGARLADMVRACTAQLAEIVTHIENTLPQLLAEHRLRLAVKLREAVETAFPAGFNHIKGEELSERLSQESALFALRIDVAEEISRLRAHLTEVEDLINQDIDHSAAGSKRASVGKRLDFLCQELNREANTLGSKSGSIAVTRYAMELKLLIEQIREQAQNLE